MGKITQFSELKALAEAQNAEEEAKAIAVADTIAEEIFNDWIMPAVKIGQATVRYSLTDKCRSLAERNKLHSAVCWKYIADHIVQRYKRLGYTIEADVVSNSFPDQAIKHTYIVVDLTELQ